jgi:TGF-beta propeptide.
VRLFALLLVAAACVLTGAARASDYETVALPAADDVSLPFLCAWGYDWEERCYRDRLDRLELGGAGDKVWRTALRFSLDAVPPSATILSAELWLRYDGTCVAPRRRTIPCDGRSFGMEARPIYTEDWYSRREVAFGPAVAYAELDPGAAPQWVVWDLTDTVTDWLSGSAPNDGILLKLLDEQESYDEGGPALPSSRYGDDGLRPRLVVTYMT